MKDNGKIRTSATGATRDTSQNKLEIGDYICPEVLIAFSEYMFKHQFQSDGTKRSGNNHKKGFGSTPKETMDICFASYIRHTLDLWMEHDGFESRDGMIEAMGGAFFNLMDFWAAWLKQQKLEEQSFKDIECFTPGRVIYAKE